jgi:hypothetical protein
MANKTPFTLRIDPETRARLRALSARTKIPEGTLAAMAIEAALDAADAAGGTLSVPIRFSVATPIPATAPAAPITPPAPAAPITQKPPGQFAIRGPDGKIVDVQTFEQKPVATPQKKEVKSC